jgi:hypothetical protein
MKVMSKTTGLRNRDIFTSVKDKYLNRYGKGSGIVITQSYLRLQSAVLSTQSSIQFGVLVNELAPNTSTVDPSEKRLSLVDNFLITEMRFSLLKVATGDTASISPLFQYPNEYVFTGSGEAKNLESVYNSSFSLLINGETILDSWDVRRHYRVGTAQQGLAVSTAASANTYGADTHDSASYGYFPVTPQIELRGNAKNKLTINLPVSVNLAGTSSSNYIVCELRGLLVQNGSAIAQR